MRKYTETRSEKEIRDNFQNNSVNEVASCVEEYLEQISRKDYKPTIDELAIFKGIENSVKAIADRFSKFYEF